MVRNACCPPLVLPQATHRKVLDVLNRVGLSDSLLRLADRRHRMDKLLVYGGMLVVVLIVGLLYWWLKA
jgi:Golgi SNAP receptor complex protein 2